MNAPARLRPDPRWLEPRPDYEPTFTLDRQIAHARREMGEARWAELQAEWNTPAMEREEKAER